MEQPAAGAKYTLGSVMNDFTFRTIQTRSQQASTLQLSTLLSQYKAVVLNFWDTSCSFCRYEFPGMEAAYKQYQNDIALIAVDDPDGMGTTLVAGYWQGDTAYFVNVGDSRAYRIAKDGILQITKDHSLVQQMIDRGEITPAQGRTHPRRNIITRAVGSERFVSCDEYAVPIREGDRFLLCSDGLTNALEEAEMHRVLLAEENAENACRKLVDEAIAGGARDNVTAIVIYAEKGGAV